MKHRILKSWLPDLPDHRDHTFEISAPIKLPPSVDLRAGLPPVYDQGDLGSCTANAIAAAFDFERNRQKQPFITPSRLFIYFNERVMEDSINEDAGAMIRDGIKSVAKLGVCPEDEWQYNVSRFADLPPQACYDVALANQALSYRRIIPSVRAMQYCLAYGFPFVFGFSVYESFETDEVATTGIVPMPGVDETLLGGHAVLACGYDQAKRMFLVRNSWGEAWGEAGYCWMPYDYLASPDLADDRWCIKRVE